MCSKESVSETCQHAEGYTDWSDFDPAGGCVFHGLSLVPKALVNDLMTHACGYLLNTLAVLLTLVSHKLI